MPGTILVSVLELADLPPALTSASFTGGNGDGGCKLKVSMGRTEYQTRGKEELSFRVLSLRDNLVVVLHDVKQAVISQAVVKTMQLVEKGHWDAWFEMEGGGRVRMKLQFILNDNERKRIRNMRESALNRKTTLQPKTSGEESYSGDTMTVSYAKDATVFQNEAGVHNQRQKIAPEADNSKLISLSKQLLDDTYSQHSDGVTSMPLVPISGPDDAQGSINKESDAQLSGTRSVISENYELGSSSDNQWPLKGDVEAEWSGSRLVVSESDKLSTSSSKLDGYNHLSSTRSVVSENYELASSSDTQGLLKGDVEADLSGLKSVVSKSDNPSPPSSRLDDYDIVSPKKKSYLGSNRSSSVKKMVSAFETRLSQEKGLNATIQPVKQDQLRKAESAGSLKGISSEKFQSGSVVSYHINNQISSSEAIVRSFSEGKLSSMDSRESSDRSKLYPKVAQDDKNICRPDSNEETLPKADHNKLDMKHDTENLAKEYLVSSETDKLLDSAHIKTCDEANVSGPFQSLQMVNLMGMEENTNRACSSSALEQSAPDVDRGEIPDRCHGEAFRQASAYETSSSTKAYGDNFITESIPMSHSCLEGSVSQQQFAITEVSIQGAPRETEISNDTSGASWSEMHSLGEVYFHEYPSIWIRRRPCITTATKQMIDIIGGYDFSVGAYSSEDSFIKFDNDKQDIEDCTQVIPEDKIFSSKQKMMQKQNKWLLEQAVRVAIIIVACGSLFLNTGATT